MPTYINYYAQISSIRLSRGPSRTTSSCTWSCVCISNYGWYWSLLISKSVYPHFSLELTHTYLLGLLLFHHHFLVNDVSLKADGSSNGQVTSWKCSWRYIILHISFALLFANCIVIQVYLPAISGHVLPQVVRCFAAFLKFCYLVRCSTITEATLRSMEDALDRFHTECVVFQDNFVRFDFNLPWQQHSLVHYWKNIQLFGAPNGLCLSITESKHIKSLKESWCNQIISTTC